MISFATTNDEHLQAEQVVDRYLRLSGESRARKLVYLMDVLATHANGCPLDLAALANASDLDLAHDMGGIIRHIDRKTGQLTGCFLPRYAKDQG
jgi:hypothetical protein